MEVVRFMRLWFIGAKMSLTHEIVAFETISLEAITS